MARMSDEELMDAIEASGGPLSLLGVEMRRARASEAKLIEALKECLWWMKPGVTFGDVEITKAKALKAIEEAESNG